MFVAREEAANTIRNSAYFTKMSPLDLEARASSSVQDYITKYTNSIREFTDTEKSLLEEDVEYANMLTKKYPRLSAIEWKLVRLCCNIEKGFPHTLEKTIFLGDHFFTKLNQHQQVEVLLHEKMHIFQRTYPLETNILICKYWGYTIHDVLSKYPESRNNPDLNNIMYANKDGVFSYQRFNSQPKSITDSSIEHVASANVPENHSNIDRDTTEMYEHPYEKMSYVVSDVITNNKATTKDELAVVNWMKKFL